MRQAAEAEADAVRAELLEVNAETGRLRAQVAQAQAASQQQRAGAGGGGGSGGGGGGGAKSWQRRSRSTYTSSSKRAGGGAGAEVAVAGTVTHEVHETRLPPHHASQLQEMHQPCLISACVWRLFGRAGCTIPV